MNEDEILKKRISELSHRAFERGYATFSEFLNQDEISQLLSLKLDIPARLYGGYDNSERCVAGFSNDEIWAFPIVCIKISPLQQKFADRLNHRDFLGSLMNLGINRNTLGDIKIEDNVGYLFCLDSISEYIIDNLDRIKHTSVKCEITNELPDFINKAPEPSEIIVSSTRADAIISSAYKLSRNQASVLFSQDKVFVNSRVINKDSTTLKDGDIVSVRGYGKFIFDGELRRTKKDRIVISIRIYK